MEKENNSCSVCGPLAARMRESGGDSRFQYAQVIWKLAELERQSGMELFAGDCPLEDIDVVLNAEEHYTVCHYLRCRRCGTLYFAGACIRGVPVFRRAEDIEKENLNIRLWGRCGMHFLREKD